MKFKVTDATGSYTEVVHDCDTIESFKNRHFGSVDPDEYGVTVEIVEEDEVEQNGVAQPTTGTVQTAPEAVEQPENGDETPVPATLATQTVDEGEEEEE